MKITHAGAWRSTCSTPRRVRRTGSARRRLHIHAVLLDGVCCEDGEEVSFHALPRLSTADVAEVLEDAFGRTTRYLRRRGLLDEGDGAPLIAAVQSEASEASDLSELAATSVSGMTPPAGPVWRRGALPAPGRAGDFERHQCVGRSGFTLHAATRTGAMDERGREALLEYVLRPPIAQERVTSGPDGSSASR